MGRNDKFMTTELETSNPSVADEVVVQPKKISGITLDEFISNTNEPLVRKASDYLYIGFRKHCELKEFEYRASEAEWLERFKNYTTRG